MLVRQSGVSVRIFCAKRKGVTSYLIAYYLKGRRYRETFRGDLKSVTGRAREIARQVGAQTAGNGVLPMADVESHRVAVESLKPLGVSLAAAVQEYVAARQRIGGRSLAEAADYFAKHANLELPKRTLAEVTQEMLDAKKADGMTERYRAHLAYALAPACDALRKPVLEIAIAEIDDYLRGLTFSTRSRHNVRAALVTAFAFAKSRGYLPRDRETAAENSARVKVKTGEVEIFTPKEMAALLDAADDDSLPLIALGGFAGLRTAEIARLEWKDVNLEEAIITVSAAKSKTASRRSNRIWRNGWRRIASASGKCCRSSTPTLLQDGMGSCRGSEDRMEAQRAPAQLRVVSVGADQERGGGRARNGELATDDFQTLPRACNATQRGGVVGDCGDNVIPMQAKAL